MTDVMSVLQLVTLLLQVTMTAGVVVIWYRVRRGLARDTAELQRQVDKTKAERAAC